MPPPKLKRAMNYSILLTALLLFASGGVWANPGHLPDAKRDFEKKFSKTYDVNANGSVRLDNRYGGINVQTWAKNQVQIDVRVVAKTESQEEANKVFDRVTINLTGGGNRATATTTIGQGSSSNSFWDRLFDGSLFDGGNSGDFRIYYEVKLPAAVELETVAKYCDVRLPDLSGTNKLEVGYGDATVGNLTGDNTVSISYGSIRAETLGQTTSLRLRYSEGHVRNAANLSYDGRYSDVEIGTVDKLRLDVGYEEVEVDNVNDIYLRGNYSDLEVGTAETADVDGNYSEFDFDRVNVSIRAESGYGDVTVGALGGQFTKVDIDARYADVTIGMPPGVGYRVDLYSRYGDISANTANSTLREKSEGSTESIEGEMKGGGSATVRIHTAYGDISLR